MVPGKRPVGRPRKDMSKKTVKPMCILLGQTIGLTLEVVGCTARNCMLWRIADMMERVDLSKISEALCDSS